MDFSFAECLKASPPYISLPFPAVWLYLGSAYENLAMAITLNQDSRTRHPRLAAGAELDIYVRREQRGEVYTRNRGAAPEKSDDDS